MIYEDRGDGRKTHYGSGRQPWDDIVEAGWGPPFAASNVLKYLRRTKDLEHSLESARWYWQRLNEMTTSLTPCPFLDTPHHSAYAKVCLVRLITLLSTEEHQSLL